MKNLHQLQDPISMDTKLSDGPKESGILNMDTLKKSLRNVVIGLLMLSPSLASSQNVQIKANVAPMAGFNLKTKQLMAGANLELISIGDKEWRLGAGITPAVYFDEKMSGKLGPSVQVSRKFDKGDEIRIILGQHGGNTFVGAGGRKSFGGKKKSN